MWPVVVLQLLSCVWLFATPWTAAPKTFLSFTFSQSLLELMSIESVMPSNHLILCHPLLFLPSIFPSIRLFSNKSALRIRWPKYWSFSFSISPSNEYSVLISFRIDWFDLLLLKGLSIVSSGTTVQKHQFFGTQPSLWPNLHICTLLLDVRVDLVVNVGFSGGSVLKNPPANAEDMSLTPGSGRSPKRKWKTHSSILAWKIPEDICDHGVAKSQTWMSDWAQTCTHSGKCTACPGSSLKQWWR